MTPLPPSNWTAAADLARGNAELRLICPKCGAMNRPGALIMHLDPDGVAACDQCGTTFRVHADG